MKTKIQNNLDLISIVVSITALLIAFQSNIYSKKANELAREANELQELESEYRIELFNDASSQTVNVAGCTSGNMFVIRRSTSTFFSISNSGARSAFLVDVEMDEPDVTYDHVRLTEGDADPTVKQWLWFPVEIQPGTTRHLRLWADSNAYYSDQQSARNVVSQMQTWPIIWRFIFSDGTVLSQEVDNGWHSPMLDFQNECRFD